MHKRIAVLSGDGIGHEVMEQALRVLDFIAESYNHKFEYVKADIGGVAFDKTSKHCPEETLNSCWSSDAILFG